MKVLQYLAFAATAGSKGAEDGNLEARILATHYSLLTTRYSLLTTHYSPLTTHHLLPRGAHPRNEPYPRGIRQREDVNEQQLVKVRMIYSLWHSLWLCLLWLRWTTTRPGTCSYAYYGSTYCCPTYYLM